MKLYAERVENLDWAAKTTWEVEDHAYEPKRKVHNRGSRNYPHLIGSFYSTKNLRPIEYESLNERMFYYFLEVDIGVIRYYVQPIRVPMKTDDDEWYHVPDVLVFRQGYCPLLYQIKESEQDNLEPKTVLCNTECEAIAIAYGWNYNVVFPKSLPSPLPRNVNLMAGYLRTRKYYSEWQDQVINRLRNIGPCTVDQLSSSFIDSVDPLHIKPLVFHLMAKGNFLVDVTQTINSNSVININTEMKSVFSIIESREGYI